MEEYNERQRILEQQQYILSSPQMKVFYCHTQAKLKQLFYAYFSISSGIIDKSADKKSQVITLLGQGLNLVTLGVASSIASGINALNAKIETKRITQITDTFLLSISSSENLAERVARQLTLRYEDQIKELTLPGAEGLFDKVTVHIGPRGGAQTFAECAVGRMIDTLMSKRNEIKEDDLEQTLVDSVFSTTAKQGFLSFKNQEIETVVKRTHPLTDQGAFQRSGVKVRVLENGVPTIRYYSAFSKDHTKKDKKNNRCSRPDKYGYHWGTQIVVDTLMLHPDNPPVPIRSSSFSASVSLTPTQSMDDFVKSTKKDNERMDEKLESNKTFLENRIKGLENENAKLNNDMLLLRKEMETLRALVSPTPSAVGNSPSLPRHGESSHILMATANNKTDRQRLEAKSSDTPSQTI